MRRNVVCCLFFIFLVPISVQARNYPFKIDAPYDVVIHRSSKAGTKMVKVTAYGRSADKAIKRAMMDAVISLTFFGASGSGEMESCPAILLEGRKAYDRNRKLFNRFFEEGIFMSYVRRVNSTYPTGQDNVKTPKGRRIQILLIVEWNSLAEYYKEAGLKTGISGLGDY